MCNRLRITAAVRRPRAFRCEARMRASTSGVSLREPKDAKRNAMSAMAIWTRLQTIRWASIGSPIASSSPVSISGQSKTHWPICAN